MSTVPTVKIASPQSHENPDGFIVINKADFNPDVHELYGDQDLGAPTERVPTMAELLVARDQLLERELELAAEKERVAEQARANEVEAQRLTQEKAAAVDAATKAAVEKAAADKTATKTADKVAGDKK